jgi:NAD+ diphosphatase
MKFRWVKLGAMPTQPDPDDFCVPVLADRILLAEDGGRVALVAELPPGLALRALGTWDGRPLWTVELTEALDGLAAFDWQSCMTRLERARLEPAARALRLAGFRRTRRFCGACGAEMADVAGVPARRCPECAQFEWASPLVAALVAVWRDATDGGREVLLVRHTYQHQDTWMLVGGLLDPGETLEDAARREVREEVGLSVDGLTYVGNEHWGLRGPHTLLTVFTATATDAHGPLTIQDHEIAEARFFPVDALPENRIPDYSIAGRVLRSLQDHRNL